MRLIVLSLTLGTACSFELTPVPAQPDQATVALLDLGRTDGKREARAAESRAPDGLNPDRRRPDTRALDTRAPDTRSPDLRKPDLLKPDTKPPLKSCNSIYGTAPSYQLCVEGLTSCKFYVSANSTCNAICTQYQGQCKGAQNNTDTWPPSAKCQPNWEWMDCLTKFQDQICECSRF